MVACPSGEVLESFVNARLAKSEAEPVAMHVAECESCQRWLDEAINLGDVTQHSDLTTISDATRDGISSPSDWDRSVAARIAARLQAEARKPPEVDGYEITGILGQGGMGVVWSAIQSSTNREVALKVISGQRCESADDRYRFKREVELAAMLDHPHIAQVFEAGGDKNSLYFAMQLIEGIPLDEFVAERQLSKSEILELVLTICRAVETAHQRGVIHRDLKPSNILVTETGHPYVLDFGLAKSLEDGGAELTITRQGSIAGTPAFMAPEQARGDLSQIGMCSDVYSLGVILYRLLVGQSPHDLSGTTFDLLKRIVEEDPKKPSQLNAKIDEDLDAILLKALARAPDQRYGSAGALARDLQRYRAGDPVVARPATVRYVAGKWVKKHRLAITLAGVMLVGSLTLLTLGFVRERNLRTVAEANERLSNIEAAKARTAAERANQAEETAQNQTRAARQQLYFSRIALAEQYRRSGYWQQAMSLLDECPEELRSWEWHFLRDQVDRVVAEVVLHAPPQCFAFSQDDRLLYVGLGNGDICALNPVTGASLSSFAAHQGPIRQLVICDTQRMATVGDDSFLRVWDVRSNKPLFEKEVEAIPDSALFEQLRYCVALSSDGARVATIDKRTGVAVYDVASGELLFRCEGHSGPIVDIAFSRSANTIATIARDDTVRVWSDSGETLRVFQYEPSESSDPQIEFVGESNALISAAGRVQLWNSETGASRSTDLVDDYSGLQLTRDGRQLVVRNYARKPNIRFLRR